MEKIFRGIEELKSEMKSMRKVTEGLKDSKRKTSDNAVAGLFPFQAEENLRSFERSCLNEKFREAVVGCSLLLAYISYIHMYLIFDTELLFNLQ